jgi:hypothetical protein
MLARVFRWLCFLLFESHPIIHAATEMFAARGDDGMEGTIITEFIERKWFQLFDLPRSCDCFERQPLW